MYCNMCGCKVVDGSRFCPMCGSRLQFVASEDNQKRNDSADVQQSAGIAVNPTVGTFAGADVHNMVGNQNYEIPSSVSQKNTIGVNGNKSKIVLPIVGILLGVLAIGIGTDISWYS